MKEKWLFHHSAIHFFLLNTIPSIFSLCDWLWTHASYAINIKYHSFAVLNFLFLLHLQLKMYIYCMSYSFIQIYFLLLSLYVTGKHNEHIVAKRRDAKHIKKFGALPFILTCLLWCHWSDGQMEISRSFQGNRENLYLQSFLDHPLVLLQGTSLEHLTKEASKRQFNQMHEPHRGIWLP